MLARPVPPAGTSRSTSRPEGRGFGSLGWTRASDLAGRRVDRLAARLIREHGPVELIVNNVGISTKAGFLDLGERDFDHVFRTNLRGPWFFTRRLVQVLVDEGRQGSVLFVSSLHDTHLRLLPHYSATKAAVSMLAREIAHELAPHGIRVNAISPGWIDTNPDSSNRPSPDAARLVPMGRLGHPDEVAVMAVVLLSDAWSGYVTGANVRVDGGLALHTWSADVRRLALDGRRWADSAVAAARPVYTFLGARA